MNRHHLLRRLHRTLVPVAALPLLLTALSGSLYGALSARGIEAFWLMKLHTGNFGAVNLQPYDSMLLGLLLMPWTGGSRSPNPFHDGARAGRSRSLVMEWPRPRQSGDRAAADGRRW